MSWAGSVSHAVVLIGISACASAASIAVDIGHYQARPGAISARGIPEFTYNAQLARELTAALRAAGHVVRVIGEAGNETSLGARAPQARGMDLFISVHHDSMQARFLSTWTYEGVQQRYSDRVSGYSLFVSRNNRHLDTSLRCASAIGQALREGGYTPSRYHADPVLGENRPFADEPNGVHYFDNLAVLRTAPLPALLFEAGVIINRDEELRMREPAVRAGIVAAIAAGVARCLPEQQQSLQRARSN